jgi:hypothetical protein
VLVSSVDGTAASCATCLPACLHGCLTPSTPNTNTKHTRTHTNTQLRERRDFEQLKTSDVWGAAKKMPGKQPAQGQAWWQAWLKQLSDCGLLAFVSKTFSSGSGAYQVLEVTRKGQ